MLNTMVDYTSANIEYFHLKFWEVFEQSDKYIHCKATDLVELKAFIGILYLRACMKIKLRSGYDIWYHESSNDIFAASMSWKCFFFLARFLSFGEKTTRPEQWNLDRSECIRDIFE